MRRPRLAPTPLAPKPLAPSLILTALILTALPAAADLPRFQPADATLYSGWPGLETDSTTPGTEFKVFAIADDSHGVTPKTYYMILAASPRSQNVVGAMECDTRFEPLGSGGNGASDILCGNDWGTTVYIMGADGMYKPQ